VPANKHTYLQDDTQVPQVAAVSVHSVHFPHQPIVQTINNPDGTVSVIQIDTGDAATPHVITLADGTQAQVVQTVSELVYVWLTGGMCLIWADLNRARDMTVWK